VLREDCDVGIAPLDRSEDSSGELVGTVKEAEEAVVVVVVAVEL